MNPEKSLMASMWVLIIGQTIGGVDLPGSGPRKLPAPRNYVAVIVLWSLMGLAVDAGSAGLARATAMFSWLVVLTGMVVGPFGKRFLSVVTDVAKFWPVSAQKNSTVTFGAGSSSVPAGDTLV